MADDTHSRVPKRQSDVTPARRGGLRACRREDRRPARPDDGREANNACPPWLAGRGGRVSEGSIPAANFYSQHVTSRNRRKPRRISYIKFSTRNKNHHSQSFTLRAGRLCTFARHLLAVSDAEGLPL